MQFKTQVEERQLVGSLLHFVSYSPGFSRPLRKYVAKLAAKFLPNAETAYLKPKDRVMIATVLAPVKNKMEEELKNVPETETEKRAETSKRIETLDTFIKRVLGGANNGAA